MPCVIALYYVNLARLEFHRISFPKWFWISVGQQRHFGCYLGGRNKAAAHIFFFNFFMSGGRCQAHCL